MVVATGFRTGKTIIKTDRNMAKKDERFLNGSDRGIWRKVLYLLIAIIAITSVILIINFKQEETLPSENETSTKNNTSEKNKIFIEEKIKSKLIGMEITYYGVAGNALVYNVSENDIKMINETLLDGKRVWKVRVGEAMSWDIYFDEKGDNIVKIIQLFRT